MTTTTTGSFVTGPPTPPGGQREVVIRLDDVHKTYVMGDQQVHALAGVDLSIYRG